jgi:hypothetical protein
MQSRTSRKYPAVSWFGTVDAGNIIFTANRNGESEGW